MNSGLKLLFLATSLILAAACAAGETPGDAAVSADTGTAAPAGTAAPNVVTITASDYKFAAPDQIPAGLTTFKLLDTGKEVHHASLIRLKDGKTYADMMATMKAMKPGTQPPAWIEPLGGPNGIVPGGESNATVMLEPGNYALVCFVPDANMVPHFMHGMTKGFTVTETSTTAAASAPEPTADITLTLSDYKFDWSTPLTAGPHVIRVETAAGQPHEVTLFQIPPGKTLKDLQTWLNGMKGEPPAMPIGGVSGLVAGKPTYFSVDLKPGDYAAVCFLEDHKDGKPHFVHGMTQAIKVS